MRILRLPMRPYALGHELILLQQRNPLLFLTPDEFVKLPIEQRIASIMGAAIVCSLTWNKNQRKISGLRFWGWLNRNSDWPAAVSLFREYRSAGSTHPKLTEKEIDEIENGKNDGRMLGGDLMTRLTNYCVDRYQRFGFQTPFDFPFGLALHLYFTDLEIEGRIHIENESEKKLTDDVERETKAILADQEETARKAKIIPMEGTNG